MGKRLSKEGGFRPSAHYEKDLRHHHNLKLGSKLKYLNKKDLKNSSHVGKVKFALLPFFLQSFELAMQDFHPKSLWY